MGTFETGIGEGREKGTWGVVYITGAGWKPIDVGGDIKGLGAINIP